MKKILIASFAVLGLMTACTTNNTTETTEDTTVDSVEVVTDSLPADSL